MAVTRDGTTSKLRQPDIIEAIRDVQRAAGNRAFRPAVMEMLLARFQMVPTKGQLSGMLWREGLSVGNDGVLRETDGAAALDLARKRSREEVDRRRQQREHARAAAVAVSDAAAVKPLAQPKQPRPASVQQKPVVVQPAARVTMISPAAAAALVPPLPVPPPPVVAVAPPLPDPPASPEGAPRPPPTRQASCVFPLGDPGTREFHYCDDATFPGRPYCLAHCTAAYQGFKPERKYNEATASYAGLFPARHL
jgi:GcrA cell cycle regulator